MTDEDGARSERDSFGELEIAEVTRAVHERDNLNGRFRKPVHQAVSAHEEFAHNRVAEFRDNATALSERRE